MTAERTFFGIGLLTGLTGLIMLFASPSVHLWWLPFVLSGVLTARRTTGHEPAKDASGIALTVAFVAVAVLFGLLLIPASALDSFHLRVPDWAYAWTYQREGLSMWARIVVALVWAVVTLRRLQQLKGMTAAA